MIYRHWSAGFAAFLLRVLFYCPCLCLCLLAGSAQAANSSAIQLTLREAIARTLDANPGVAVYRFREDALAGLRTSAGLKPPLQVNGGVEDTLGSGALKGLDSTEFTLSLSQVIELGEQRDARLGVAGQRADLLRAEQRVTELDLLAEVTRRFITTAAAQELLVLQQRATELARQTLQALEPLVDAGQTPASEQARATAALESARLAEARAQMTLEAANVQLSSMWASQAPEFEGVSAALLETGDAGDLTALLLGVENNPDLLLFTSEERLLDAQMHAALSERRGTLQWTAGVRHLREVGDTGFVFGLSMPLGSRARASGAIATAEANFREVAARRDIALNQIRAQLYALHLQLTQAILEVNTLRDKVLPPLNSALAQTREAYLGGRYSYLELTSAQREYLDAELALINAAADAHLLRAEIERLSGAALNPESEDTQP